MFNVLTAQGATMEAVNHSKNSAMEADTISKHGAILKSHTSRRNLMKKIFAIAFAMLVMFPMTACSSNSSQSQSINNNLIGVWEGKDWSGFDAVFVFFANGAYGQYRQRDRTYGGKYSTYSNLLMLTEVGNQGSESNSLFTFNISGNTLTLIRYGDSSEESKVSFKKVK